jgi:short-subunit dehydrogenase
MMDAAAVAEAGLEGMWAGRAVVIPGLVNKLTAATPRFVPRGLMTALVRFAQERDGGR